MITRNGNTSHQARTIAALEKAHFSAVQNDLIANCLEVNDGSLGEADLLEEWESEKMGETNGWVN